MKKFLWIAALALACCLALSAQPRRGQLMAGAAKVDVTPGPDQLGRNTYGVLDRTHVRAIIFTNGQTVAGLANVDGNTNQRVIDAVNERLE